MDGSDILTPAPVKNGSKTVVKIRAAKTANLSMVIDGNPRHVFHLR